MGIQSRSRAVHLSEVFPRDEPLAPLAARAVVLYGDLQAEERGLTRATGLEALDELSHDWRILHFLRSNLRSLSEARPLLVLLNAHPRFEDWIGSVHADVRAMWNRNFGALLAVEERLKTDRNAIGGHVGRQVGELIDGFDEEAVATHEGDVRVGMMPRLAADLVSRLLFSDPAGPAGAPEMRKRIEAYGEANIGAQTCLGIFMKLYMARYPALHLDLEWMPFATRRVET